MYYDYLFEGLTNVEYIAFLINKNDLKHCKYILENLVKHGYTRHYDTNIEDFINGYIMEDFKNFGNSYITIGYNDDTIWTTNYMGTEYGYNDVYENHYIMNFRKVFTELNKPNKIYKLNI